jgi:Kef-type K+ transport system membrane component KefB
VSDVTVLRDLGLIILAAALFSVIARPARIPSIVAYILAGLALGPVTGILSVSDAVHLASEIGIALLLFLVGLELSLDKVKDVGRLAFSAGGQQMAITAVVVFLVSVVLGFSKADAFFLAVALSFSSTVVVVKLLAQRDELDSVHGRGSVGILLVQDLVVIVVLTFVAGLGRGGTLELGEVLRGLAYAFAGMTVLLVAAGGAARWLLPPLFRWIARSPEALFIWALAWCFILIEAAALLSLSLEMGAFLAGMSLAQLPYSHEMRRRVEPLMNFFVAVFFVALGVQMDLGDLGAIWVPALAFSTLTLVGKPLLFLLLILPRLGMDQGSSARVGITLAQSSEFSFILAALAFSVGLIDSEMLALLGLVGLLTMGASSYMVLFMDTLAPKFLELARRVPRLLPREAEEDGSGSGGAAEPKESGTKAHVLSGHIIIVGMNSLGRRLARDLTERNETVLAVDSDPRKLRDLPCETLMGNAEYLSVLRGAGLERARLLISALNIEEANSILTHRARSYGIPVSVHAFESSHVPELQALGADHLMVARDLGAERLLEAVQQHGAFQP